MRPGKSRNRLSAILRATLLVLIALSTAVILSTTERTVTAARLGIEWTGSLFSQVSYEFAVLNGDLGSVDSHNVFFATGLRF